MAELSSDEHVDDDEDDERKELMLMLLLLRLLLLLLRNTAPFNLVLPLTNLLVLPATAVSPALTSVERTPPGGSTSSPLDEHSEADEFTDSSASDEREAISLRCCLTGCCCCCCCCCDSTVLLLTTWPRRRRSSCWRLYCCCCCC